VLLLSAKAERVACMVLCAGSLVALRSSTPPEVQPRTKSSEIRAAYLNDRLVDFRLVPPPKGKRGLRMGPWYFGERVSNPRPRDKRLNLYLVTPGEQHRLPDLENYDHSAVISALPSVDQPVEWDVYWAVVLDPAVQREFRSESDII